LPEAAQTDVTNTDTTTGANSPKRLGPKRPKSRLRQQADTLERRVYSVYDAAKLLNVSNALIYEAVKTGKLGAIRIGWKRRFEIDPLAAESN
jgi:excisionase family DNA binding protein